VNAKNEAKLLYVTKWMYEDSTHIATELSNHQDVKLTLCCYEVCWSQGMAFFLAHFYMKFVLPQDGHYNEMAEPEFAVPGGSASAPCPSSVH
jgi:hypothetical protein